MSQRRNGCVLFGGLVLLAAMLASPPTVAADQALPPGSVFSDCADCPEMVSIAPGTFIMGSPEDERGRYDNEGPRHEVTIGRAFALGKYHVTVGQFRRFVEATGYARKDSCDVDPEFDAVWKPRSGYGWWKPGFEQGDDHPAVCVNWHDAVAYVEWLNGITGARYRLPTEAEWEYAARAGTKTVHFWGDSNTTQCDYANGADVAARRKIRTWKDIAPCHDGYVATSPVGHFKPNAFGLHDMLGNAWQLVQDCYTESYNGAPVDGSAWQSESCKERIIRGGSWGSNPRLIRSAVRGGSPYGRYNYVGFRLARDLATPAL
jgi:formylglycine-generating enzyme required for sulfatase activity